MGLVKAVLKCFQAVIVVILLRIQWTPVIFNHYNFKNLINSQLLEERPENLGKVFNFRLISNFKAKGLCWSLNRSYFYCRGNYDVSNDCLPVLALKRRRSRSWRRFSNSAWLSSSFTRNFNTVDTAQFLGIGNCRRPCWREFFDSTRAIRIDIVIIRMAYKFKFYILFVCQILMHRRLFFFWVEVDILYFDGFGAENLLRMAIDLQSLLTLMLCDVDCRQSLPCWR